ncbi:hypothetical protein P8X24_11525 [Pyrococcus kukulkanii]|uniref:hypothetical protein n=1 Tax=Pyrococcus kukulkanii TaxID=1609559 RepID=UPI0035678034
MYINLPFSYYSIKKQFINKAAIPAIVIGLLLLASFLAGAGTTYYVIHRGDKSPTTTQTTTKNATTQDVLEQVDYLKWLNLSKNAKQEAYKQLAKYTQQLISDFVSYDYEQKGALGDLKVQVYGPDKVYGFSAFPVQIRITVAKKDPDWAYLHLQRVTVYVINTETGQKIWSRTWSWSSNETPLLNGDDFTLGTVLKTPDDYVYKVKQAIESGTFSQSLYMNLTNAIVPHFEIGVEVEGERELWEWKTAENQTECEKLAGGTKHVYDSSSKKCYIFQGTTHISVTGETTSAYLHTTGVPDFGQYGVLVASAPKSVRALKEADEYQIYQQRLFGALSNFVIVSQASSVHVMDSVANWIFTFKAVPEYFDPLIKVNGKPPVFSDDFRIFVMRVLNSSTWELAYTKATQMTDFKTFYELGLPVKYTSANGTVDYVVVGLAYLELQREDGVRIPIWFMVNPKVSVQENFDTALTDQRVQPLTTITNKTEITEADLQAAQQLIDTIKQTLEKKKLQADELIVKAQRLGVQEGEYYAKRAKEAYDRAEKALDKYLEAVKSRNNQLALNWLNVARKMEDAGDFWLNAAIKATAGLKEQAKWNAEQAQKIEALAKQYEPHLDIFGTLSRIKLPFGLQLADLIVIIIAFVVSWFGRQFLGPIGALLGIVILAGWFSGKLVGGAMGWLIDKIKFW